VLRKSLRDAERLNDIVADLLELARLDTATPAIAEPVDLAQLVVDELGRRTPTAVVLTRLGQQVVVRASRIRLARLLGNLLDNAERHTTNTIEIVVTADPPNAVLEVIDDGPGIAPADREKSSNGSPAWTMPVAWIPAAPGSACPSPARSPRPTAVACTPPTTPPAPASSSASPTPSRVLAARVTRLRRRPARP